LFVEKVGILNRYLIDFHQKFIAQRLEKYGKNPDFFTAIEIQATRLYAKGMGTGHIARRLKAKYGLIVEACEWTRFILQGATLYAQ